MPEERLFHVASFRSIYDNEPRQLAPVTWEELTRRLSRHRALPVNDEGKQTGELWSPTEYKPGTTRSAENVLTVGCFVLDMDDAGPWDTYLPRLSSYSYVLHTTYNHTEDAPRWRIVLPLSAPIPGYLWGPVWERLAWGLAGEEQDVKCKDACRIYYLPAHPPGGSGIAFTHEGRPLDPARFTEGPPKRAPSPPVKAAQDSSSRVAARALVDRALSIARSEGRNAGLFDLLCQLADNGYGQIEAESIACADYLPLLWDTNTAGKHEPFTERNVAQVGKSVFSSAWRGKRAPWAQKADVRREAGDVSENGHAPLTPHASRLTPDDAERVFITAPELMALTVVPRRWPVKRILPEGLAIFAGKTKTGKSWVALALGVAVASGGKVFGHFEVEEGDVLYLALEDNEESLQERLGQLLGETPPPEKLTFALDWKRTNQGGLSDLEAWLIAHPNARLVMIDVLTKIRPRQKNSNGHGPGYEDDYDLCDPLKALADRYRVTILLLHHLRKMTSEDPVDQILGSVGMSGAPDTTWVWRRPRKEAKGTLLVTGRRIKKETEHLLLWDEAASTFVDLGDPDLVAKTQEQEEILQLFRASGRPLRPKEVSDELGKNPHTVRKLLQKLKSAGLLQTDNWGAYSLPPVQGTLD